MISFRTGFRNIKKDKESAIINIAGLTIGISCFLVLFLYIADELSYDKFYNNSDRTYRIFVRINAPGFAETNSKTSGALRQVLEQNFPEIETSARIGYFGPRSFRYNNKAFRDGSIYAVDSTFFKIFNLQFIKGNPATALIKPNSLVLTETASKRIFGNEDPVGTLLPTDEGKVFLITGVIKDFPQNSHFRCAYLESMSSYEVNEKWLDLWFSTYITLRKGTDASAFEKKLAGIVRDYVGPQVQSALGIPIEKVMSRGNEYSLLLQPLTSIYLESQSKYGIDLNTEWGDCKTSNISYIYVYSAVALFILLIAVINFTNLATAKSEQRAREVGVRKTLGASRLKLITQFISESILVTLLAVILALVLIEMIIPWFNVFSGKQLSIHYFNNFYTIPMLLLFVIVTGILAGSYPAMYLSSFQPAQTLKANFRSKQGKKNLRSMLVIIQFSISIALLIGTLTINKQIKFIQNKNLGFNKDYLLSISNAELLGGNKDAFKNELLKRPGIISVTNGSRMFQNGIPGSGYLYNKQTGSDPVAFNYLDVDYDFLKTFQMKLLSGRFFAREFSTDTSAVIINETAMKMFSIKNIDGKFLTKLNPGGKGIPYNIIGILKDFNYESLHRQVRPLILHLSPPRQQADILTIRIGSKDITGTLDFVKKTWGNYVPEETIMLNFVDQNINKLYQSEEKTAIIASLFSGIAIFIACMGLFGLASFITTQRTKEIGIRKVLGASMREIIFLLWKEFAFWIVIANIIAWPAGYYIMTKWLNGFAFRITLGWEVFLISGLSAILVAIFTVSLHAYKAASANPVTSLKYE